MKLLLLALFITAVAAAPKLRKDENQEVESIVPGPVILPEPELPVVAPDSVLLPAPVLPVIIPDSVILPEPELPVVVPEPGIIPEPELPEIDSVEVPELPPLKPVVPSGEVFNDGIVQVKVHTDTSLLSSVHNWVSLVLNYIKNGIQSTHQILGY